MYSQVTKLTNILIICDFVLTMQHVQDSSTFVTIHVFCIIKHICITRFVCFDTCYVSLQHIVCMHLVADVGLFLQSGSLYRFLEYGIEIGMYPLPDISGVLFPLQDISQVSFYLPNSLQQNILLVHSCCNIAILQ